MNLAIYVVVLGGVLLFVPQMLWIGAAMVAIGAILVSMGEKNSTRLAYPSRFGSATGIQQEFMPQARARNGVSANVKNLMADDGRDPVSRAQDPFGEAPKTPFVENGNFNLPVPIAGEVNRFLDTTYSMPTKANGVSLERDKRNPFLPQMD